MSARHSTEEMGGVSRAQLDLKQHELEQRAKNRDDVDGVNKVFFTPQLRNFNHAMYVIDFSLRP